MNKKIFFIFIATFFISFLALDSFFKSLVKADLEKEIKQTSIIHEHIRERFKLLLKLPLSIGLMGADYFSDGNFKKPIGEKVTELLALNKDIRGLTLLDVDGQIIRSFPQEKNKAAVGKVTQNIQAIKESFSKGETFYLSEPFKLYQGENGFGFYVPILNNNALIGWFVPVVSSDLFFKKFELTEFLKSYDLVIKDYSSGINYFEASGHRDSESKIHESKNNILGRELVFILWRKGAVWLLHLAWYWKFLISIFLAIAALIIARLLEHRKIAQQQLNDISVLLRLTSKEALSSLVDMHTNSKNIDPGKSILHVTNLVEQIDLLQTMAQSTPGPIEEKIKLSSLMEGQIAIFEEIIDGKNIEVLADYEKLSRITIHANRWLLQNSVFSNILSHLIIYTASGSKIHIDNSSTEESHIITFHALQINSEGPDESAIRIDRRLEVAKRLLRIYQGDMYLHKDLSEGMIIRIVLPNRS